MEHEKPFSGSSINTDSEFRSDWNSQLYCIINKTFPLSQIVYRIDLENMNATKVFQLNTIESDITIGKSEFAFQKAYWTNPWSVVLFQGFTTPISRTGVFHWTPRTAFQSFRNDYVDRCFYAGDRLYLERRIKNNEDRRLDTTVLFAVEDDSTLRELYELKECVNFWYESAILAHRPNNDFYDIYDLANERFFQIARESDDSDYPDIIIRDGYLYISTNKKVTEYCLDTKQPAGTVIWQNGESPDLCFSDGCIFLYSSTHHLLKQYNISQHAYVAEYNTASILPTHLQFLVHRGFLLLKSPDEVYVYRLSDGNTSKIDLK
ncbi:MAG: hypothetical protein IJ210_10095 [Clostridia bacterium]|nr:hypothetical protein [Clostridia bacterium]